MSKQFLSECLIGEEVSDHEKSVIKANLSRMFETYGDNVRIVKATSAQDVYLVFVNGNHVWDFNPFLVNGNGVAVAVQKIEDSLYTDDSRLLLG